MSQHVIRVDWDGESDSEHYTWTLENGSQIKGSAAPDFGGDASYIDPEEAYVAALSSCHLLSFVAQSAKEGYAVATYHDDAVGILEKNRDGLLAITQVVLHPSVTFAGAKQPTDEVLSKLHQKAHKYCFIANSVNSKITIEPQSEETNAAG